MFSMDMHSVDLYLQQLHERTKMFNVLCTETKIGFCQHQLREFCSPLNKEIQTKMAETSQQSKSPLGFCNSKFKACLQNACMHACNQPFLVRSTICATLLQYLQYVHSQDHHKRRLRPSLLFPWLVSTTKTTFQHARNQGNQTQLAENSQPMFEISIVRYRSEGKIFPKRTRRLPLLDGQIARLRHLKNN